VAHSERHLAQLVRVDQVPEEGVEVCRVQHDAVAPLAATISHPSLREREGEGDLRVRRAPDVRDDQPAASHAPEGLCAVEHRPDAFFRIYHDGLGDLVVWQAGVRVFAVEHHAQEVAVRDDLSAVHLCAKTCLEDVIRGRCAILPLEARGVLDDGFEIFDDGLDVGELRELVCRVELVFCRALALRRARAPNNTCRSPSRVRRGLGGCC